MKNIHILKKIFQIIITLSLTMFASIPSFAADEDECEQYTLDYEEECRNNEKCQWNSSLLTCQLKENTSGSGTNGSGTNGGGTTTPETDKDRFSFYTSIEGTKICENMSITVANCTQSAVSKCNGKEVVTWRVDPGDTKAVTPAELCTFLTETSEDTLSFRAIYADTTINCESGYYLHAGAINANGCTLCEVGHMCIGGALTPSSEPSGRTACPSGTYQTKTGQAQCDDCTNKSSAGTYKSDETGIYHTNGCSWSMPICDANYYYDTTSKACSACQSGYYNDLKSKVDSSNVMCYKYGIGLDLCKSSTDYTAVNFPDSYDASNFKTCTPNKYTLNIYAEYMHNGITTRTERIATKTLTYDSKPNQAIYSVYSGTQNLNSTITNLNNTYGAGKYFAPTSTGNAYLEINGTKYTLQSNYSGGDSGNWMMYENDHAVLAELSNKDPIDMYLIIQTQTYNVYMISSGVTDSGPGNTFYIDTNTIVPKKFGSKPSDGVTPNKSLVTTCISDTNYAYIPDTATPKYYECTNTNQTASKVANTSNGSATMFEPSKSGNNICIAYQMTTCEEGHSCNSCVITPCAAGYYQNETGKSSCIPCTEGYYQDQTGQTECKPCGAGKATGIDGTGATTCDDCGPGSYSSNTVNSLCELCSMGKYQDQYGQSECKLCAQGTISTSDGATSCTNCYNGKYQPDLGQTSCKTCPAGTVSANDNKPHKSCTNCYNGQYQPNDGQASCATCPSGSYTTNENKPNSECEGCGAGTYYNETETGCIPCPAGTYQPYELQTECFSCQDGTTHATAAISGLFTTDVAVDATVGATARDQCYINPTITFKDLHGSSQPLSDNDRIYWRSTP